MRFVLWHEGVHWPWATEHIHACEIDSMHRSMDCLRVSFGTDCNEPSAKSGIFSILLRMTNVCVRSYNSV